MDLGEAPKLVPSQMLAGLTHRFGWDVKSTGLELREGMVIVVTTPLSPSSTPSK